MSVPGGPEWIVILLIVVLLFGAKKLPELGGSVGKSIKEFKKGVQDGKNAETDEDDTAAEQHAPTSQTEQ
ncbi:MAG TPA: twin-arginine translocase TatA/TatE family subunit [Egibacteraceae bacterium]|nr:twin-arginine translocase TatA/TatE family subunit [Egibacteraceae bacterium]